MKKHIWQSVTPEELAAQEASRKPTMHELRSQWNREWAVSIVKLRGSNREKKR